MGAMDVQLESTAVQHGQAKINVEEHALVSLLSDEKYATEKTEDVDSDDYEKLEEGIMQYGYVFFFFVLWLGVLDKHLKCQQVCA